MLVDIIINGCYLFFFQTTILVLSTLTKKSLTPNVMLAFKTSWNYGMKGNLMIFTWMKT